MKNDSRRIPRISVSERDFMLVVAGQIYAQAPNHEPRKITTIMNKVKDKFREQSVNIGDYRYISVPKVEVGDLFTKILFSIPEFEELNLSHVEYHTGVKVADDRSPYMFTSAHDIPDWKHDFIDLDAFIRNVERLFWNIFDAESDCFGCANYQTKDCEICVRNRARVDRYENSGRTPRNENEKVCKYDCIEGYYLCCESCKKKDDCSHICEKCSNNCELLITKKEDEN